MNIKDFFKKVKGGIERSLSGDFLESERVEHNLGWIFYCFLLVCAFITWSLYVEKNLSRIEKNEAVIEDLQINYHQRTLELVGMNNRSRIEQMLEADHSELKAPVTPPQRIVIEKR